MATQRDDAGGVWRLFVDTGGTFTDAVGLTPGGSVRRVKVLSTSALRARVLARRSRRQWLIEAHLGEGAPEALAGLHVCRLAARRPAARVLSATRSDGTDRIGLRLDRAVRFRRGDIIELISREEAPVLAARLLTGTPPPSPWPARLALRLGTTRGTNALLEHRGSRVAFFVTAGLRDLLLIGTQQREDLFALEIRRLPPLHERVIEVPGRIDARGRVVEPLDLARVRAPALAALRAGVDHAAIALMHAWINPAHERRLGGWLRRLGFVHVSRSSDLSPTIGLLNRARTAVVNARLAPELERYLRAISDAPPRARVHVMTSAGGLVRAERFLPRDSLLSGPAGGVVAAAALSRTLGYNRLISVDMGGTSCDVARFDRDHEYTFEHRVAHATVSAPALAIESVAAGGGSVCTLRHGALSVGPRSAGAEPGPACYGRGGPLTLTDCLLLLGRLDPRAFAIPLDIRAARRRAADLTRALRRDSGGRLAVENVLDGCLQLALEQIAGAVRQVSTRRGFDPASHVLVVFGGAGPQIACALGRVLGIDVVVIPPDAGLFSALGLAHAPLECFAQQAVLRPLDGLADRLPRLWAELDRTALRRLAAEGVENGTVARRMLTVRLQGQETALTLDCSKEDSPATLRRRFQLRYESVYGHRPPPRPVDVESARVIARGSEPAAAVSGTWSQFEVAAGVPTPHTRRRAWVDGRWMQIPVFVRRDLKPGMMVAGPALIGEAHTTTVLEAGWHGRVHATGALVLTPVGTTPAVSCRTSGGGARPLRRTPRPIRDELLICRLADLAADMGEVLRRTALSVNVKERLDYSCAILDGRGRLIVSAPHIPVHLGALGVCVRATLAAGVRFDPGDAVVTNHPAFGGSHLPDLTVIVPVHDPDSGRRLAFAAVRAHHAEIGGMAPGSMPVAARSLAEEGVVIEPIHLVRRGRTRWSRVERRLRRAPFPSRAVADNLADLHAQLASAHRGVVGLVELVRECGWRDLTRAMRALLDRSARACQAVLRRLESRGDCFQAMERLDDGSPLGVTVTVRGGQAVFDFEGSAPVHPGNFNATPAIVRAGVMYVLRLMIAEPLPLNEGLLAPVVLRIPPGMLNPPFPRDPRHCCALAAGNVETSQRLVDTLIKALHLSACSQGTMNNVVLGNERFAHYETICGGAGAGPGFHGASAVHTHMTNTRITDAEILEHRCPLRVEQFHVRDGSGGAGRWRGGDGVVRALRALAPCTLSLITQHRVERPFGLAGGQPGAVGTQRIVRAGGRIELLPPVAAARLDAGDVLVVETPGGGGYGPP